MTVLNLVLASVVPSFEGGRQYKISQVHTVRIVRVTI